MKSLIFLALSLLFLLPAASAAIDLSNLNASINDYNKNIDNAPSVLRALLGDERVNITLKLNNSSTESYGIVTKNAKIVEFTPGGLKNPTIEVYGTEAAINNIVNAQDAAAAYRSAESSGQVKIEGKSLTAKLKLGAALSSSEAIKYFFGIFS
jgi:hypothetical protein